MQPQIALPTKYFQKVTLPSSADSDVGFIGGNFDKKNSLDTGLVRGYTLYYLTSVFYIIIEFDYFKGYKCSNSTFI